MDQSILTNKYISTKPIAATLTEYYELIVTAYLLFDKEAKGFITKKSVEALLEEQGGKNLGSGHFLSEQRWKEMVRIDI